MTDQGFPGEGRQPPRGSAHIILQNVWRKLHKNERIWTGGVYLASPMEPPLDVTWWRFFLNRSELSLNSVNSILTNNWSMNWGQSCPFLTCDFCGWVVRHWATTQEVASSTTMHCSREMLSNCCSGHHYMSLPGPLVGTPPPVNRMTDTLPSLAFSKKFF